MIYLTYRKGDVMKSLVAEKYKRNNEKLKAQANKNKQLVKAANKSTVPQVVNEEPAPVMKESKTLMLDI